MIEIEKREEVQLEPSANLTSVVSSMSCIGENQILLGINQQPLDGSSCISQDDITSCLLEVMNKQASGLYSNANELCADLDEIASFSALSDKNKSLYCKITTKQNELDERRKMRKKQISILNSRFFAKTSRFADLSIDDLTKLDCEYKRYAHAYLDMLAKDDNMNLILCGSRGIGKTSLACAIIHDLIERKLTKCSFVNIGNYLSACMKCNDFSNSSEHPLTSILNSKVVLIDDFGHMRNTAYGIEQIFTLVDEIYKHNIIMIVTTNFTEYQVKNNTGDFSAIISRMLENSIVMPMKGEDIRKTKVFSPEQMFG